MIALKLIIIFLLMVFMFDRFIKLEDNEKVSLEILYVLEVIAIIVGVFVIIKL